MPTQIGGHSGQSAGGGGGVGGVGGGGWGGGGGGTGPPEPRQIRPFPEKSVHQYQNATNIARDGYKLEEEDECSYCHYIREVNHGRQSLLQIGHHPPFFNGCYVLFQHDRMVTCANMAALKGHATWWDKDMPNPQRYLSREAFVSLQRAGGVKKAKSENCNVGSYAQRLAIAWQKTNEGTAKKVMEQCQEKHPRVPNMTQRERENSDMKKEEQDKKERKERLRLEEHLQLAKENAERIEGKKINGDRVGESGASGQARIKMEPDLDQSDSPMPNSTENAQKKRNRTTVQKTISQGTSEGSDTQPAGLSTNAPAKRAQAPAPSNPAIFRRSLAIRNSSSPISSTTPVNKRRRIRSPSPKDGPLQSQRSQSRPPAVEKSIPKATAQGGRSLSSTKIAANSARRAPMSEAQPNKLSSKTFENPRGRSPPTPKSSAKTFQQQASRHALPSKPSSTVSKRWYMFSSSPDASIGTSTPSPKPKAKKNKKVDSNRAEDGREKASSTVAYSATDSQRLPKAAAAIISGLRHSKKPVDDIFHENFELKARLAKMTEKQDNLCPEDETLLEQANLELSSLRRKCKALHEENEEMKAEKEEVETQLEATRKELQEVRERNKDLLMKYLAKASQAPSTIRRSIKEEMEGEEFYYYH